MTILQVRDEYMKSSGDTELKHFAQYCDYLEKKVAELSRQLENIESSRIIHSHPQYGFYYWVKFNEDTEYEVAYCYRYKNNKTEFQPTNGESAYTNEVSDWKQEPIIFNG